MISGTDRHRASRLAWAACCFLSLAIPAVKQVDLIMALGADGFNSAASWPGDMYFLVLLGILGLILSGVFVCLARWLSGSWPRTVLVVLGTLLGVEIVQDVTMVVTVISIEAVNMEACGYPTCPE